MNQPDQTTIIMEELASIKNYIEAVRGILKTGFMPSMAGLEGRVETVCTAVKDAPKDVQQKCLPVLGGLLKQLKDCEEELRAFHEARPKTDK